MLGTAIIQSRRALEYWVLHAKWPWNYNVLQHTTTLQIQSSRCLRSCSWRNGQCLWLAAWHCTCGSRDVQSLMSSCASWRAHSFLDKMQSGDSFLMFDTSEDTSKVFDTSSSQLHTKKKHINTVNTHKSWWTRDATRTVSTNLFFNAFAQIHLSQQRVQHAPRNAGHITLRSAFDSRFLRWSKYVKMMYSMDGLIRR